jgi:hypothetical protein
MIYAAMLPFYVAEDLNFNDDHQDAEKQDVSAGLGANMETALDTGSDVNIDMEDDDVFDSGKLSDDENVPSPQSIPSPGIVLKHIPFQLTTPRAMKSHKRQMEKIVRELCR